jgi:hypothetical protein
MHIETKIKQIGKSLKRAKSSGNFRRIHKWENALEHAHHRMCPWNPLSKTESLFRLKKRVDAIKFRSDFRIEDYKWDWCGTCRCAFVRCPNCGNNCCNAMVGKFRKDGSKPDNTDDWKDLVDCPICDIAYDIQHFAYRIGANPTRSDFPNADEIERKSDECWSKSFDWLNDEERKQKSPDGFNDLFNATSEELGKSAVDAATKSQDGTIKQHD